uniref:(northern house mosquito) hypothetical protein n=1 Tax=Culex pipiens TaxID=7175 RepID=A0A8D8K0L0_CULPI
MARPPLLLELAGVDAAAGQAVPSSLSSGASSGPRRARVVRDMGRDDRGHPDGRCHTVLLELDPGRWMPIRGTSLADRRGSREHLLRGQPLVGVAGRSAIVAVRGIPGRRENGRPPAAPCRESRRHREGNQSTAG